MRTGKNSKKKKKKHTIAGKNVMYLEFRTFGKLIQDPKSITRPAVQGVATTAHLPNKKHGTPKYASL